MTIEKRKELIELLHRAQSLAKELDLEAQFQIHHSLSELGVSAPAPAEQPVDVTPYDDLTGTLFSAIYGLPIDEDGPETIEALRLEFPTGEKDWRLVRKVLETITLEQLENVAVLKRRGQLHVVRP